MTQWLGCVCVLNAHVVLCVVRSDCAAQGYSTIGLPIRRKWVRGYRRKRKDEDGKGMEEEKVKGIGKKALLRGNKSPPSGVDEKSHGLHSSLLTLASWLQVVNKKRALPFLIKFLAK